MATRQAIRTIRETLQFVESAGTEISKEFLFNFLQLLEETDRSPDSLISQERLMQIAGLSQKAALRRHLRKAAIPFKELKGRIFTTEEAITASICGRSKRRKTEPNWDALK